MTDRPRRRSLRGRLAAWMVASTLLTLLVFSGVLYAALRMEAAGEPVGERRGEEAAVREVGEQVLVSMLVAAPLALLVAVGGALALSRRALAPLQEVLDAARQASATDLRRRLALPARRDELYDLTVEMNALLARLEEGFTALARYAGDASHELRTPLAAALTTLEVALRHPRPASEWERTATEVHKELRRLARLVESLLALARADGPLEQVVDVDLRELLDLVLAGLAARATGRGVTLSAAAEGDAGDAHVRGDFDALASAARNVIENAIHYTPTGGRVRAAVRVRPSHVELVVDDSGPGVSPEDRALIFEPLRRGGAVPEGIEAGHGLGLAIVRRVLARHGGTATVDASPDGGARFVLRVPRGGSPESGERP
ncbi:MAG: HAMP domain-containing protein [Myxococcaceae bacterium]|nr:MAG: HAMP domain-containing protein [Myxococcaceae bacterium]